VYCQQAAKLRAYTFDSVQEELDTDKYYFKKYSTIRFDMSTAGKVCIFSFQILIYFFSLKVLSNKN
jgi:hypothetical protein